MQMWVAKQKIVTNSNETEVIFSNDLCCKLCRTNLIRKLETLYTFDWNWYYPLTEIFCQLLANTDSMRQLPWRILAAQQLLAVVFKLGSAYHSSGCVTAAEHRLAHETQPWCLLWCSRVLPLSGSYCLGPLGWYTCLLYSECSQEYLKLVMVAAVFLVHLFCLTCTIEISNLTSVPILFISNWNS